MKVLHLMSHDYLSFLGVEVWSQKQKEDQFHLYPLMGHGMEEASLLIDFDLDGGSKLSELVASILKSLNLRRKEPAGKFCRDTVAKLENDRLILILGKPLVKIMNDHLQHLTDKIIWSDAKELLASPLKKRELWSKLQNFT